MNYRICQKTIFLEQKYFFKTTDLLLIQMEIQKMRGKINLENYVIDWNLTLLPSTDLLLPRFIANLQNDSLVHEAPVSLDKI